MATWRCAEPGESLFPEETCMVTFQQLHLCPGAALDQAGSIPSGFWLLSLSRSAGAGGHSESPTFGSEVCRLSISRGGSSSVICGERPRSLSCLRSFKQNLRGRGKRRSGCEKQNRAKTRYCLGQQPIRTDRTPSRHFGNWRGPWALSILSTERTGVFRISIRGANSLI